ncbi:MAG: hypothetical protein QXW70_01235 [Candidatus Anstonellales archaeon]
MNVTIKEYIIQLNKNNVFYLLIGLCFILFLLTKNPVFGVLIAIFIFSLLVAEVLGGVFSHGLKKEIKETLITILYALGLWFGASILLGASSPINGIVTCSMLPNLERGDLVILSGGTPKTQFINVSISDFNSLLNPSTVVHYDNYSVDVDGSFFSFCAYNKKYEPACTLFLKNPEKFKESRGGFTFTYSRCEVSSIDGQYIGYSPCIDAIIYQNQSYRFDKSNDIIVYSPHASELYYPNDIIHRVFLGLRTDSTTYYLTRGDNNPVADIQAYNYINGKFNVPPSTTQLKGKVLLRIPYMGYFKLFISFFQIGDLAFIEPEGCKSVLQS